MMMDADEDETIMVLIPTILFHLLFMFCTPLQQYNKIVLFHHYNEPGNLFAFCNISSMPSLDESLCQMAKEPA